VNWIEEHIRNLAKTSGFDEGDAKRLFVRKVHVSIDAELHSNRTYRLAFLCSVNLLSRIFPSLTFDELPASKLPILPWTGDQPLGVFGSSELTLHFGKRLWLPPAFGGSLCSRRKCLRQCKPFCEPSIPRQSCKWLI
jgi:hypothetical protein